MKLVEINNATKEYITGADQVCAVNDISLTIEEKDFIALVGHSGSGKSTLLTMLGGLSKPTRGTILIDDINIYNLSENQLADFRHEYIGFVFQSFQLVNYLTVEENVILPLIRTEIKKQDQIELAKEALHSVGLYNKSKRLIAELSGGEQQRTAIARALINDPIIILADEPTGNLDTRTSGEIMDVFSELNDNGKTIVMVTHNREYMSYAVRSIELLDGKIIQLSNSIINYKKEINNANFY